MSHWSDNPELYDEIIFNKMVEDGLVSPNDDRPIYEIVSDFMKKPDSWKLASDAEADYWADKVDEAMNRLDR